MNIDSVYDSLKLSHPRSKCQESLVAYNFSIAMQVRLELRVETVIAKNAYLSTFGQIEALKCDLRTSQFSELSQSVISAHKREHLLDALNHHCT